MAKIILNVNDKKLNTLLTILDNLKDDIIINKTIEKNPSLNNIQPIKQSSTSKYIDAKTFKERLKRMKKND